jgi:hypothetical protein
MKDPTLSPAARVWVLIAVFLGLLFDGFELGLMPVASLSVSKSLLGDDFTPQAGGDWFARFTAALMLGAAWVEFFSEPWVTGSDDPAPCR